MALCYRYNENKEYIGSEEMFKDQLESELQKKDIWLLPADCTLIKPPKAKNGFLIVWNGDAWEYKEQEKEKEPEPYIPPEPTDEELQSRARQVRDAYMEFTQNRIDRYRNQKEADIVTTDSESTYKLLLQYTQYLRDYPSVENWWLTTCKSFWEFAFEDEHEPEGV